MEKQKNGFGNQKFFKSPMNFSKKIQDFSSAFKIHLKLLKNILAEIPLKNK